jgi:hypothetical protein
MSFDSGNLLPCIGKYRHYKYTHDSCYYDRFDRFYKNVNHLR